MRRQSGVAALADTVDVVGLTDNHAGQARMSPLAAVALAREQGVATVIHVSSPRSRTGWRLKTQVMGAPRWIEGVLCLYGDRVKDVPRVEGPTPTALIGEAHEWGRPHNLAVGAVVNPFAEDLDREVRLLERKLAAGATFLQSQMVFDVEALRGFFDRTSHLLADVQVYAGVALLRNRRMADFARGLPGCVLSDAAYRQICAGGGVQLAIELAAALAEVPGVDALHVFPLGAENDTREVAATFRTARGVPAQRG